MADHNHNKNHGPLFALPPLPPLFLPHHKKKGIQQAFLHLHSCLSEAAHEFQHSLASFLQQALTTNPFLLAILPPQLQLSSRFQVRGKYPRDRHLLSSYGFAAVLPGDSVAAAVVSNGIFNFLNIYNTLLIVRLILTWFPDPPQVIVNPLSTLCDPYLNLFRGIIPPLGGTLDFSPILAFFVLNIFTNTAAALPAELPSSIEKSKFSSASVHATKLTWAQKAWLKRHSPLKEAQNKESHGAKDEET